MTSAAGRPLALVTGGHRRLGAAIARMLAAAGHDIAIHGSRDADPEEGLAEAFDATDARWSGFIADFADADAPARLMADVVAHFGRAPHLLVNSASIFGQDRIGDVDQSALMAHYAVNTAAPALLTQAFAALPADRAASPRNIVNILDQRIAQPHGDQLSYSLSKHALAGLTQIAARDLAPAIRVNAVAPGLTIVTEDYQPAQIDRLTARMPLARLPGADEVAGAVLFLAQADAVTGQTIFVDGGAHMVSFDGDFVNLDR